MRTGTIASWEFTPTDDDYQSVLDASRAIYGHLPTGRSRTVNEDLLAWSQLIDEIEDGYSMNLDEYTNDLQLRARLERTLPMLTPRVRERVSAELTTLDARFLSLTRAPDRGLARHQSVETWARVPLQPDGELAEDLRAF